MQNRFTTMVFGRYRGRALFATLYGADEPGVLELRAIMLDKSAPPVRAFCAPTDMAAIAAFIKQHGRNRELYFAVALRLDHTGGDLKNCGGLTALFADFDFKDFVDGEAGARAAVGRCPIPPTAIVKSGGGLHAYWLLVEPLDLRTEAATAKDLLRRLARYLGADPGSAEPAHVLRIPSTVNHKYNPPRQVTIEILDPSRSYQVGDFDWLPSLPVEEQRPAVAAPVGGGTIREGGRNIALTSLAGAMRRRGASAETITAALVTQNATQYGSQPLPAAEVREIVRSIGRYEPAAAARPAAPEATVDELLAGCGLPSLPNPCDASQAEPVLRTVREALRGADALRVSAVRSRLADELKSRGIRGAVTFVDAALAGKRGVSADDAGKPSLVPETDPWPDRVDGAAVADAALTLVRLYVVMPTHASVALVLWIIHTYLMDCWQNSPILTVWSPAKRCGKTQALTVAAELVYRKLSCASLTPAVIFRLIEKAHPTLLLDEADTWLTDEKSELRGIVNSGHTKTTAAVGRCEGDDHEVRMFSTWGAKLLAMIGKPPGTILDRSIVVEMRRRAKSEPIKPLRSRTLDREATPIRRQFKRWADDHAGVLTDAEPVVSDSLNDRAADSWRPLLAIADALGGAWPLVARQAAADLSGEVDTDDDGLTMQLLADVRLLFADRGYPDAILSKEIVEALNANEDRPWHTVSRGRPLDANRLGRMLKDFKARSKNVRTDGHILKGYWLCDLKDAFERYIPPSPPAEPATPLQPNEYGPQLALSSRYTPNPVAGSEMQISSMNTGLVAGVAGSTPDSAPCDNVFIFEE